MVAPRPLSLLLVTSLACAACSSSTEAVRPASLTLTSGDAQTAPAYSTLEPFVVTVMGSDGRPYRGATVTWTITGSGSLSSTSSTTDSAGRASSTLTLGAAYGVVLVEASTPGAQSLVFSVTSVDPCLFTSAMVFGATSSGALALHDCTLPGYGSFVDYWGFTLAAPAVQIDMTAAFDTYLLVYAANGAAVGGDDDGGPGTDSRVLAILPPGYYEVGANSYYSGVTGPYSITTAAIPASATGCLEYWLVPGVTTSQSLATTDCVSSGAYGDVFSIVLTSGQTITVSQSSSAINAYAGLLNSSSTMVASDDDSGPGTDALFSYTAPASDVYYLVATSVAAGELGAYTLGVTAGSSTAPPFRASRGPKRVASASQAMQVVRAHLALTR